MLHCDYHSPIFFSVTTKKLAWKISNSNLFSFQEYCNKFHKITSEVEFSSSHFLIWRYYAKVANLAYLFAVNHHPVEFEHILTLFSNHIQNGLISTFAQAWQIFIGRLVRFELYLKKIFIDNKKRNYCWKTCFYCFALKSKRETTARKHVFIVFPCEWFTCSYWPNPKHKQF